MRDVKEIYTDDKGCYIDHAGNHFAQLQHMCSQYDVEETTFIHRIERGYDLRMALTSGIDQKRDITPTAILIFDTWYPNKNRIAKEFDIALTTLLDHEDDLEQYLMSLDLYVYEGNPYRTISAVSAACGITESAIRGRLSRLWDWVSATTIKPTRHKPVDKCYDHLGNEYDTKAEMLMFYKIPTSTYHKRKGLGWSLEKILTTPVNHWGHPNKGG